MSREKSAEAPLPGPGLFAMPRQAQLSGATRTSDSEGREQRSMQPSAEFIDSSDNTFLGEAECPGCFRCVRKHSSCMRLCGSRSAGGSAAPAMLRPQSPDTAIQRRKHCAGRLSEGGIALVRAELRARAAEAGKA